MSKIIEKWIVGNYPPETNMGWVDTSGETPINKIFVNGKWVQSPTKNNIQSYNINTSEWSVVADKSPYTVKATIVINSQFREDTIVELINDNAVLFATYGFAIGEISGQNVTLYSLSLPNVDITLKFNIV